MLIDPALAAVSVVTVALPEASSDPTGVCVDIHCPWQDIQMSGPQFEVILVTQHFDLDINVWSLP